MNQILGIQILRAVAALMVVFSHAQSDALNEAMKRGAAFSRFEMLPLDAGVDLFFVISGFIMVYASRRLFATPGAGLIFAARRIARIVPLYWLCTAIGLLILAYAARRGEHPFPGFSEIASSLGFFPFARPGDGQPRPIVPLGWTLNYEMFFYAVFALFLGLRRGLAVAGVASTLALAVGLGAALHPRATVLAYWSDPIVLEFVLGMGVALAWEHGFRIRPTAAIVAIVVALGFLALDLGGMAKVGPPSGVDPNGFIRFFACGLPMALIFAAVVLLDPPLPGAGRLAALLVLIGDASYALYLFHPLAIIFARKAYLAADLSQRLGFWPLVFTEIPLAVLLALLIHIAIEKPLSKALHARLGGKSSTVVSPVVVPMSKPDLPEGQKLTAGGE